MSVDNVAVEPKNIYLALLIKKIDLASEAIYERGLETVGLKILLGIVNSLHKGSKEDTELKKAKETLEKYFIHSTSIEGDANTLFSQVVGYLMDHYLTETNLGIVPAISLPATKDPPKNEATQAFMSADTGGN